MTRARPNAIPEGEAPAPGRWPALAIPIPILLSAFAVAVETVPETPGEVPEALAVFGAAALALVPAEPLARLRPAPDRRGPASGFRGIADQVSVAPSLRIAGANLGTRRVRRLRLCKLLRHTLALDRIGRAFRSLRVELTVFPGLSAILPWLAAAGISVAGNAARPVAFGSIPEGVWRAVATLTTVGCGCVRPVAAGGGAFAIAVPMVGLDIVAVPTGPIATASAEQFRRDAHGIREAGEEEAAEPATGAPR